MVRQRELPIFFISSTTRLCVQGNTLVKAVSDLEQNAEKYRTEMPKTMVYSSSMDRQYLFVIPDGSDESHTYGGSAVRGGLLVDMASGEQFFARRVKVQIIESKSKFGGIDSYQAAPTERVPYVSSQQIPPYRPNAEYTFIIHSILQNFRS